LHAPQLTETTTQNGTKNNGICKAGWTTESHVLSCKSFVSIFPTKFVNPGLVFNIQSIRLFSSKVALEESPCGAVEG
jgi:hypothetical protein